MVESLITMGACTSQNQEIEDYQTTSKINVKKSDKKGTRNYNSAQDPRKFKDH